VCFCIILSYLDKINIITHVVKIYFGGNMKDCLVCMALGFIAGALVVANNQEAKRVVEKGKKAVKDTVKKITD
jgi:hypothetical protein